MVTTVEVLRAARAKIEKGWVQYTYEHEADGAPIAWCAAGAISRQHLSVNESAGAYLLLRRVCGETVSAWNDAPGRTKEEVLAAFDRAIALAEREGGARGREP